jgi:hypothetical protein
VLYLCGETTAGGEGCVAVLEGGELLHQGVVPALLTTDEETLDILPKFETELRPCATQLIVRTKRHCLIQF